MPIFVPPNGAGMHTEVHGELRGDVIVSPLFLVSSLCLIYPCIFGFTCLNFHIIQSRQNILQRAKELKKFRFSGYICQLEKDLHLIRFVIVDFENSGFHPRVCIQDLVVKEEEGYLSARSKDGSLSFDRLM